MMYLDIHRVMADRGIDYPSRFLQAHGFTDYMAGKLVRGRLDSTSFHNIEKLCLALNCTPTELFSWKPDDGAAVPATHALYKLIVTEDSGALGKKIRALSPEKIEELRAFVQSLEQE